MAENTESYFGKCHLTKVSNFYKDLTKTESEGIATHGIVSTDKVQVIHYPDCQQLVFHMPKYAYDAGSYQLIDDVTGAVIEDLQVKNRLNGGTMMLINTLPYKPGSYTIKASWPDGWTHQIQFTKFKEGFFNAESINISDNHEFENQGSESHSQRSYEPKATSIKLPRDPETGFLAPRSFFTSRRIKKQNVSKPALTYTQDGRGGKILYRDGDIAIAFDWEFAGGNAVVFFLIPEEKFWEAQTKTPLSRRDEILTFVADQVIKDQAPGCRFEMYSNHISIVR